MKANIVVRQLLSIVLSCLIVFQPGFIAMAGDLPIVVDPAAPDGKKPTMDQSGNGVPIEQIATPGKGGISHNLFTDFNVNKIGLIINNSKSMAKSQLGGFIAGNPNLKGGEARLILNEVTGANRSYLEGYTELHGAKADYILANPNGITINGGGFVNFPRVTLTTGTSRFGAGGLEGIDVRSGDILVEGEGVNATEIDAFTLLAQATRINANIYAKTLTIAAGQNSYNPTNGSIASLAHDGTPTPSVAIDSSALGGMYAGRIVLQGTEAGVGVNLEGVIQSADSLELTADGQIRLRNKTTAGTDIKIHSHNGDVAIEDTVYAGTTASVSAADDLTINPGASGKGIVVGAAEQLKLAAAIVNTTDAKITAGLQADGTVSGGSLSVTAMNQLTTKDTELVSGDSLSIVSPKIAINGGKITAVSKLGVQGSNSGDVTMTGAAELSSLNALEIEARSLTAADGLLKADDLTLSLAGDFDLGNATLSSTGALALNANSLKSDAGTSITSFTDMFLTLDTLQNDGGLIYAGNILDLNVRELSNTSEGYIVGVKGVAIEGLTTGSRADLINNNQSVIESSDGYMNIAADIIENISGAATVTTKDVGWEYWHLGFQTDIPGFNDDGTRNIYSERTGLRQNKGGVNAHLQLILEEYGLAWNRPYDGRVLQEWIHRSKDVVTGPAVTAEILSASDMTINADSILNDRGLISGGGNITVNANSLENRGLELSSHLDFYRNFLQVHDSGKNAYGQVQQHFETSQVIDSVPAVIAAAGTLDINVPGHVNNESFKEGEQYSGRFAGNAAYSDLEVTGPIKDPNTGEPVNTVSVSLPTGVGSLYVVNKDPGQTYLIETNPALTNVGGFYGSQYFFDEVGVNVTDLDTQILGDAFFETNMIRKQVLQATGKRYLSPTYASDADQFRQLMDNAAQTREDLGLEIGVALTADQLTDLTSDIVWYETREVMGKEVLVPVVYLGSVSQANLNLTRGAMLTGTTVNIQTAELNNSGAIVGKNVTIDADNVRNHGGDLTGQTLGVTASNDIVNKSGSISGGDVSLSAGHNVVIETKTEERSEGKDSHGYIHQTADVSASGNLNISSGGDTSLLAAKLSADGAANITAAGDVAVGTKVVTEHIEATDYKADQVGHMGSSVKAGNLSISSGNDVAVVGSDLSASGNAVIEAVRDVNVTGVTNSATSDYEHSSSGGVFGGGGSSEEHTKQTTVTRSSITADGDLAIKAGTDTEGSLSVVGSKISAKGDVSLKAADMILISSAEEEKHRSSDKSSSGLLSSKSSKSASGSVTQVASEVKSNNSVDIQANSDVTVSASNIHGDQGVAIKSETGDVRIVGGQNQGYSEREEKKSGIGLFVSKGRLDVAKFTEESVKSKESGNVASQITSGTDTTITAANDATIIGSTVAAEKDVNIAADRDVNIIPGRNSQSSQKSSKEGGIGIGLTLSENEVSISAGYKGVETKTNSSGKYNAGSLISAGNDVKIDAGRNINQVSSEIEAGQDVNMKAGEDLNVTAAQDVEHLDEYVKSVEVGLKLAAKQSVSTAIRTLVDTPKNMTSGEGGVGAKAVTAGSGALQAVSAAQQVSNPSASVSLTAGLSMTESRFSSDSATSVSSQTSAGRDANIEAGKNLTIEGATVLANEDVALTAGEDIAISSAANNRETSSSSSSISASAGIGATVSAANGAAAGVQVSGAASGSDSDYRSDSNTNAQVVAGQDLTVKSGQDTTVAGANLEGNKVNMDVGDNLVVASKQDTSKSKSSNWSIGGSATIGMGASVAADAAGVVGMDADSQTGDSANIGMGKGSGSSAWVNNQTSIVGKEQVDIRVENNTHVEGAVIAAENGNLKLDTNTLTYKDIYDHDKASSYQASLSGSVSAENEKDSETRKDGEEGNPYAGTLEGSSSSHDRRQINRATIGEGEIIIRSDPAAGLEGLNRDLAKAQEITKNEKTSVTVYIDSAAIEEVMSGGEGIKNNFNKIAEKIKELLPEDAERMREVIQSQQDFRDQLEKDGIDSDEADRILGENAVAAVLKEKLDKYVTETGELNITEEQAEDLLKELRDDPTVVLQVASTWDYDLQTERARLQRQLFSIVGIAKSAGATAKGALMFLNDYSGEIFYFATGGALFKAEHESFHKAVNELATSIGKLATDPVGSLKAVGQEYQGRLDQYYKFVEEGKQDEAGLVMGTLIYDVGEFLVGAGAAGAGILKGTKKLAGMVKGVSKGAVYAAKVDSSLLIELIQKGVKVTADDVLFTQRMPDGKIAFLEKGNSAAGLTHIIERHASQFVAKGIPENEILDAIYQAIKENNIIGYQGKGTGRPIFEYTYNGKRQRIAITVSENGFVVGANPKSIE
ncbi:hemagglutinin repeat-containing protein [Pseudodesulfovibrio sediminis]|uniref:Filamentous haemagglutinin FhaB/tRNA nuclease CdiA-like TPS domain-containing protein n=1 Tax=Pseudodesulfovibrio sediminis TaxID=2810563 RepID=A0ABM7P7D6_9BACT|nr:hemagglutinin repeat-containing protein [Pseudodesulfovibrio sediminis]BCS88785.1 hypothetical protein PSDVSF_20270 [Pseudodesulfovibrio sediminis]